MNRSVLLVSALALSACAAPPPRAGPPVADKQRLYGDAGLVPTREGERVRKELALAGELRGMLDSQRDVAGSRIDVELAATPPRVVVGLATTADDESRATQLEHYARRAAAGVVGPRAEVTVLVERVPADPQPAGPSFPIPLALALLGLGVSAGIAIERRRTARRR